MVAAVHIREPAGRSLWQERVDLAAAFRLAARFGFNEGVCNHFSLAVSPQGDRFLVNPYGIHWSAMRASDLLLVDGDGTLIEGGSAPEKTAFFIHSRIHLGAPRATCVLHTHMPYATALTSLADQRLAWIGQTALMFYGRTGYLETYNGLAHDADEGDRMMAAIGDNEVIFLANHGVITLGPTVADAFSDLYYLERACQNQVLALSTGQPLREIDPAVCAATARQMNGGFETGYRRMTFEGFKRLLDRGEPDYAT